MSDPSEPTTPGSNLPLPFNAAGGLPAMRQPPPPAYYGEEDEGLPLEHYLNVILRRKWLLAAIAFTAVVLAALQAFTVTPMYRASARLLIDPESSKVIPFQEVAGSEMAGGWFMENYMWTQTEVLESQGLALRVVQKLDLVNNEAFNTGVHPGALYELRGLVYRLAKAPFRMGRGSGGSGSEPSAEERAAQREASRARQLRGGISAEPVENTRLIEVSYRSPHPELAAAIVNTLTEEFIEQNLEGKYDATIRASTFLRKQLEDLQIEVERSEQELLDYAQRSNIVSLSDRETISRKRLADLSDELTLAETELITYRSRYDAALSASVDEFPQGLETEAIRRLAERLSEAKSRLASFSSRYGPEWPSVKETRLEIEELEQQLREEKRGAIVSARQDFQLALDRYDRFESAVAGQRDLVDELNNRSIQYNIIEREVDSNKELYEGLLQRLKEAGVAAGLRSSNIRIADRAEPPRGRSTPRRTRSMLLAMVLGLFLGTGLIFLLEALDNTLKTSDDVTQKLGLPALGVVPSLLIAGNGRRRLKWPMTKPVEESEKRPRLVFGNTAEPQARALEAYRSLRTALLLSHSGTPPQTILVTSALPGEGKSTTVANTAIVLAQTGARTLIIDLDMRKPSLAGAFGITAEQGMSTFLSGNSD
ncbi:MAG: polysaccharide biosynthesis tyrosine autokinase, partial [Thermoanaerobaculia bacterium]